MTQLLFDLTRSPNRWVARIARALLLKLVRRWNPEVRLVLDGHTLVVPLSHDLAWFRREVPTYNENLRRLAAFLRARDGGLRMIDVGANVGDTWALTQPAAGDAYLLIEGEPAYFHLLERNTAAEPSVTRVATLLSDRSGLVPGSMVMTAGNARVDPDASAGVRRFDTLDAVIDAHPGFRDARFLKVDVEGFDTRVLRGAHGLLSGAAPVLLFEHHPRLITLAGDDDRAVFSELAALGYGTLIVYDNRGFLLGTLDPRDQARIAELVGYARQQDGYYYDLACFPERRAADRDAFLAAERTFCATLGTVVH